MGPDGRPKGTGIVAFDNPEDARNAINQFNGYDWNGRQLEVREDRFAGSGGPGGGFGGRGGFMGGRGGFGGGYGGGPGGFGGPGADAPPAEPNPFTDYATSGGEPSPIIYVRNVSHFLQESMCTN